MTTCCLAGQHMHAAMLKNGLKKMYDVITCQQPQWCTLHALCAENNKTSSS
jgi:hypothetical protein